jgi:hypothetical protein
MSQHNLPARITEASQHTDMTDLVLSRLAVGTTLDGICHQVADFTTQYESAEIRGPSRAFESLARLEQVDAKSLRNHHIRARGITPRILHFSLSHLVPSVLEQQEVESDRVEVDRSRYGEYYIALGFDSESTNQLLEERRKIWEVIGRLGKFSPDNIPWMSRSPTVRLAYIPTEYDIPNARKAARGAEALIEAALPMHMSLKPIYKEALTIRPQSEKKS